MPENDIKICDMSTPSLAYLGDCVLELLVRERLTLAGISSSKSLNKEALKFVSAPAQAAAMKNIIELLTEEESGYFRRGRNIGHTNTPKNATVAEYRTATGMEALSDFFIWLEEKNAHASCSLLRSLMKTKIIKLHTLERN